MYSPIELTSIIFRKSTSLDNINLPAGSAGVDLKAQWKSYSLQRGAVPPGEAGEGVNGFGEEEDIYGRCTNIKLTTFSEQSAVIIKLNNFNKKSKHLVSLYCTFAIINIVIISNIKNTTFSEQSAMIRKEAK